MRILFVVVTFLSFFTLSANIKGRIVDSNTNEEIIGASVYLKNQKTKGTVSGLDGSFLINHKPEEPVTIVIGYIGYKTKEIVTSDASSLIVKLEPDEIAINEVVIIADNGGRTDRSARSIEKTAVSVVNVVSAKAMEISPDMTVGSVISRVSGVTIERNNSGEGQYALLRGMDKRFNYTLVNGVKIPGPDNKNRFVPLDIFPSDLLDRLEVTKALTADMEADGIGGSVNMVMKDAPVKKQFTINFSTGYNTRFFNNDYKSFDYGSSDNKSPNEKYGDGYPVQMKDFSSSPLKVKSQQAMPNINGGMTWGGRIFDNRLGIMLAGSYSNSVRGNTSDIYDMSMNTDGTQSMTNRVFYNNQIRSGAHAKLDYNIAPGHKIVWYNAYMDFRTAQIREAFTEKTETIRMRWNHQTIFNSTLKGIHNIIGNTLSLDWSVNMGRAFNETPDNIIINTNVINGMISVDQNNGATRRWENNSDNDKSVYLNLNYKKKSGASLYEIALGGVLRDKVRDSFFNEYTFKPYDPDKANSREQIKGTDWNNYDEIKFQVNQYGNISDPLNYDATERISAGYVSAKYSYRDLQVIAGARVEHTNQGYTLKYTTEGAKNNDNQTYYDILPSVHLKYNVHKDANIRLSYYEAINRPSFFEIVPYNIINEDFKERGNPDLKHTVAHNFDLRYEYYPRPSEQFMAGVFYKDIKNPIEYGFVPGFGQDTYYMPVNYGRARNYGLEVDFIKYFNKFGVKANYTFTCSDITTTKKNLIPNPDVNAETNTVVEYVDQSRPLYGQAGHVVNVSALFNDTKRGWDAQVSFSYTGPRLVIVSQWLNDDTWQAGFVQMDASVEKRFKNGVTIFAKASNLLNSPMIQYITVNSQNEKRDPSIEMYKKGIVERKERYSQNINLGIKYKF